MFPLLSCEDDNNTGEDPIHHVDDDQDDENDPIDDEDDTDLDRPYITYYYDETQCNDPWITACNTITCKIEALSLYLDEQQIAWEPESIKVTEETDLSVACRACYCGTGYRYYVTTKTEEHARMRALLFIPVD